VKRYNLFTGLAELEGAGAPPGLVDCDLSPVPLRRIWLSLKDLSMDIARDTAWAQLCPVEVKGLAMGRLCRQMNSVPLPKAPEIAVDAVYRNRVGSTIRDFQFDCLKPGQIFL
jgi:hypothetical protein